MSMVLRIAAFAAVAASFFSLVIATPAAAREVVAINGGASPGTIVVRTNERRLYLVLGEGRAVRYTVGVGRAGRQWAGHSSTASMCDPRGRHPRTSGVTSRACRV